MLDFPNIDPIAFSIGPLAVRWYSLAYLIGILGGWWLLGVIAKKFPLQNFDKKARDDLITWTVLGIILGGRLGYVLFYNLSYFLEHPGEIFAVWQGGMSFHGGLMGFVLALYLFAKKRGIKFLALTDRMACVAPLGLFCGRIANFINGELYGRVTDSPLGMIFPSGGPLPRHPSQLYQAAMEGLVTGLILWAVLYTTKAEQSPGKLSGLFLICYGTARIIGEFFRQPDAQLGFIFPGVTMGQLLSLPMILLGMGIYGYAARNKAH